MFQIIKQILMSKITLGNQNTILRCRFNKKSNFLKLFVLTARAGNSKEKFNRTSLKIKEDWKTSKRFPWSNKIQEQMRSSQWHLTIWEGTLQNELWSFGIWGNHSDTWLCTNRENIEQRQISQELLTYWSYSRRTSMTHLAVNKRKKNI